eukprot:TRINITY_DN10757_c0_g1_i2.p1 TRINITY_DN10757_c0_g1~~TRINITY_DN10757_c0_g1_i2.p1  ORF type:complete len:426 (-),score=112.75 TRINITY_DN10757_c0_g1_i2:14-1291(-)
MRRLLRGCFAAMAPRSRLLLLSLAALALAGEAAGDAGEKGLLTADLPPEAEITLLQVGRATTTLEKESGAATPPPPPHPPLPLAAAKAEASPLAPSPPPSPSPPLPLPPVPQPREQRKEDAHVPASRGVQGNSSSGVPAAQLLHAPNAPMVAFLDLDERGIQDWWSGLSQTQKILIIVGIVFFFFSSLALFLIGLALSIAARIIGQVLEEGIETLDVLLLGVEVDIGALSVDIIRGVIQIKQLKIHNPPGWREDHLLEAAKLRLDLNLWTLFTSMLQDIEIDSLQLIDVDITYSKTYGGSSNVGDLLKFLAGDKPKPPPPATPGKKTPANPEQVHKEVVLHEFKMIGVGATIHTGCGHMRVTVPNVYEKDFATYPGGRTIKEIVHGIVKCITRDLMSGKHSADPKKKKPEPVPGAHALLSSIEGD